MPNPEELIPLPRDEGQRGQSEGKGAGVMPTAPMSDVAAQEKLLRQTLSDARLTVAQEVTRKAQHGRYEVRTLWALSSADLNAYAGSAGTVGKPWPGLAQVSRIQRVVCERARASGQWETTEEVDYSITSLAAERANAGDLLKRWRVHWRIEALHWVRDVTFGEDGSQIHIGQVPEACSVLRNTAATLLGLTVSASIAAGVRYLGMRPLGFLALFESLADRMKAAQESNRARAVRSTTASHQNEDPSTHQTYALSRDAPLVK